MMPRPCHLVATALGAALMCVRGIGYAQPVEPPREPSTESSDAEAHSDAEGEQDGFVTGTASTPPGDESASSTDGERSKGEANEPAESGEDWLPEPAHTEHTEPDPAEPLPSEAPPDSAQQAHAPTSAAPRLHPRHQPIEWYETSAQLGVTVGLPFYDDSIINPDVTVDIRYGRKLGWFVPYVAGGFRQARLDPKQVPDHARRKKLEAWHMTIGLRVEVPVTEKLLPFVGVAGELAHWGFEANTTEFCQDSWYPEAWRCYQRYQWKAGMAYKAHLGVMYKFYPDMALEFLLERGQIFAPEMFTRSVTFLAPTVGFTWLH